MVQGFFYARVMGFQQLFSLFILYFGLILVKLIKNQINLKETTLVNMHVKAHAAKGVSNFHSESADIVDLEIFKICFHGLVKIR